MPCSCDARDVAVIQMKCTARPVHRLSGFYAYASTVPFVSALILTSVWVLQHVFFRVLVPLLLCSFASLIHLFCELLHKPAFPCGIYSSRNNLDHVCRPGQAVPHAVLLQVPLAAQHRVIQRTARHRSNARGVHPDMTMHTCPMCT